MTSTAGSGRLARNTLLNLIGLGTPVVLAFLSIPLLIKGIGTDRFGVLSIAWMVLGYFSLFDFGIGRALTKSVAEYLGEKRDAEIPALVWTGTLIMLLLGLIGGAVVALTAQPMVDQWLKIPAYLRAEVLPSFYLLAVSIPVVISTAAFRGVLEAYQRFDITNAIRIPMGAVSYLGPLAVLPFSNNLYHIVLFLVIGRALTWAVHVYFCLRAVPSLRHNVACDRRLIKPLLVFGSWMTVSNVISPLMTYLDRFFIGAILSVSAVAYYTTPYEAVMKLTIIPDALSSVLFPAFATLYVQNRANAAQVYERGMKALFVLLFPLVLLVVVFGQDLLGFWIGADFAGKCYRVAQLLAIGVLINSLARVPFLAIQSAGRPDLTAKVHLVEFPLFVGVLYLLTKEYGIVGAASAWLLRVSIDALVLFVISRRFLPVFVDTRAHLGLIGYGILILFSGLLASSLVVKLVLFALICASTLFLVWFRLFDAAERSYLGSLSKRFGLKG